jgi:DNA-binding winged helix-turn-helix (wHTH) protein
MGVLWLAHPIGWMAAPVPERGAPMGTEASSRARETEKLQALRFGAFEMDLRSGELRRNGAAVRLQPQPFKVLALLAVHPGEVVTREEIQGEVWPAGTFVDFEQSLNFCIRQIRSALGDSATHPRFVETLPRRGYRWVGGSVERVGSPATLHEWPRPVPEVATVDETAPDVSTESPRRLRWPRAAAAIAGVVLALGAVALAYWFGSREARTEPARFERITFRRGAVRTARFGPEQQVVYMGAWESEPWAMHLVNTGAREDLRFNVGHANIVAASDTEVAFIREGAFSERVLARAPLTGGPPREIARGIVAADWTADTTDFAVVRFSEGHFNVEYPIGHALTEVNPVRHLRLSPDGQMIAVTEHPMLQDDRGHVLILDRDGRRLGATEDFASLTGLAWAPGGDEVWFTAAPVGAKSELYAVTLDGHVRLLYSGTGRLYLHDIAADGRALIENADARWETYFRREGEDEARDLSWLDHSSAEGISADGKVVLLVESGDGGGLDYLSYLRRTDGSLPIRLGPGRAFGLSPDGKWVLIIPLRSPDHVEIVPTGPGESKSIQIPGAASHEIAGWVGDGASFYVTTRDSSRDWHTWLVDAQSGEPRPLSLPEGVMIWRNTFSPDGSRFLARCAGDEGFCIYPTEGGEPRPLTGAEPGWTPAAWDTKDRVWFRDLRKRIPERLWRVDLATGTPELVSEVVPADRAGVLFLTRLLVARSGDAWTYSLVRRLSVLYVVTGLH